MTVDGCLKPLFDNYARNRTQPPQLRGIGVRRLPVRAVCVGGRYLGTARFGLQVGFTSASTAPSSGSTANSSPMLGTGHRAVAQHLVSFAADPPASPWRAYRRNSRLIAGRAPVAIAIAIATPIMAGRPARRRPLDQPLTYAGGRRNGGRRRYFCDGNAYLR